jgi:hypothetical protein
MLAAISIVSLLGLSFGSGAYAHMTHVDLGTWKATTGTHVSFKFKITQHGPNASCGSTATARCFYALTYPSIPDSCPNGQVGGGVADIPNGFVNLKGVFSYTYSTPSKPNYVEFHIALSGGTGSGTLRNTSPQELGVENPPACDSGTIEFTARHL